MNAPQPHAETLDPVRTTVTVEASLEHAFKVFTDGFDRWWPRSHHIAEKPMAKAILEAKKDGRFYERAEDGSECEWGKVTACEPPTRIVLLWQLNGAWKYDPDASHASEVEVRFVSLGAKRTRVELEHRHFERHGETGAAIRNAVSQPGGWAGIIDMFKKAADEQAS
jgi:uncharacterized protein YndB with AHSA1/START domain